MCQEAHDLERGNGGERAESKCRKDKDHDLWYRSGPPAEFRRVSVHCLLHWSGQQQHLLQRLQALGAQEMQWAQALDKRPCTDVHGAWELHTPWTTDHRGKSKLDLTRWRWLLPRRHALSSRWLWIFNHNTCENCLEKVQGAAPSSVFPPPFFQDTWHHVQLLCVEYASETCSRMTGQWWDRSAISSHKTLSPSGPLIYLRIEDLDLILKERRLHWYGHVERFNEAAFHIQIDGKHGPGRPRMTMKQLTKRIAESRSSQLSNLMIDTPGDLVWDLPCVQQASYLEGGPLMWMLPMYLHVNQKSGDDDDDDDDV